MTLTEALKEATETKRSKTLVFTSRNPDLKEKLAWLKGYHGNVLVANLVVGG